MALTLGQAVTDTVTMYDYRLYHLVITGGLSLVVEVVPLDGSEALWVYGRFGDPHAWRRYDLLGQDRTAREAYELLVSPSRQGIYYFGVYGRDVAHAGGNYRIVVKDLDRHLSEVSPRAAGNEGEITID